MGKNTMVELEPQKETKHQSNQEQKATDQNPHNGIWYFIVISGLIGIAIFMAIPKSWEEAVTQQDDGTYRLSKQWEETILRKQRKVRKHRLYVLVATQTGFFDCPYSETGKFYLNAGEVYRFGTTGETTVGRGYSETWLIKNNLTFKVIMEGDLATVTAEQTNLIGHYPLLSENMQRPLPAEASAKPYWFRLVLPPGNKSLD